MWDGSDVLWPALLIRHFKKKCHRISFGLQKLPTETENTAEESSWEGTMMSWKAQWDFMAAPSWFVCRSIMTPHISPSQIQGEEKGYIRFHSELLSHKLYKHFGRCKQWLFQWSTNLKRLITYILHIHHIHDNKDGTSVTDGGRVTNSTKKAKNKETEDVTPTRESQRHRLGLMLCIDAAHSIKTRKKERKKKIGASKHHVLAPESNLPTNESERKELLGWNMSKQTSLGPHLNPAMTWMIFYSICPRSTYKMQSQQLEPSRLRQRTCRCPSVISAAENQPLWQLRQSCTLT